MLSTSDWVVIVSTIAQIMAAGIFAGFQIMFSRTNKIPENTQDSPLNTSNKKWLFNNLSPFLFSFLCSIFIIYVALSSPDPVDKSFVIFLVFGTAMLGASTFCMVATFVAYAFRPFVQAVQKLKKPS